MNLKLLNGLLDLRRETLVDDGVLRLDKFCSSLCGVDCWDKARSSAEEFDGSNNFVENVLKNGRRCRILRFNIHSAQLPIQSQFFTNFRRTRNQRLEKLQVLNIILNYLSKFLQNCLFLLQKSPNPWYNSTTYIST